MTDDPTARASGPAGVVHSRQRRRRRNAKLAIAVITGALAVPAVAGAKPIIADPGGSYPYPGTQQAQQSGPTEPGAPSPGTSDFGGGQAQGSGQTTGQTVFTGSVNAVSHESPADVGGQTVFAASVNAVSHDSAAADSAVVLRRDSSKADPFVANIDGTPTTTASDDGFAWGDAAIGAGAALGVIALAGAGAFALRRRGGLATRSVATGS
jgi:hypothetical protein